jgi:hypothetical protein
LYQVPKQAIPNIFSFLLESNRSQQEEAAGARRAAELMGAEISTSLWELPSKKPFRAPHPVEDNSKECTNCKKYVPCAEWDTKDACRYHGSGERGIYNETDFLWHCCNAKDRNSPGCRTGNHRVAMPLHYPAVNDTAHRLSLSLDSNFALDSTILDLSLDTQEPEAEEELDEEADEQDEEVNDFYFTSPATTSAIIINVFLSHIIQIFGRHISRF